MDMRKLFHYYKQGRDNMHRSATFGYFHTLRALHFRETRGL